MTQVADRVDALGGDSSKVAPTPTGQWREAYQTCLIVTTLIIFLIALLVVVVGTLATALLIPVGGFIAALLIGMDRLWKKQCRPKPSQYLRALLAGTSIGAIILMLLLLIGMVTPQLIYTLIASIGVSILAIILSWK